MKVPRERRRNQPWMHLRQARRREAAEDRQAAREALGDEGQLAKLDRLFGPGQGAAKERAKLTKRMEKAA